jgi:hypothetical protein
VIDSAEKRRSAAGTVFPGLGVTPNASKDAEWRQQAGWGYSGIAAGAGVAPVDRIFFTNVSILRPGFINVTATKAGFINVAIAEVE